MSAPTHRDLLKTVFGFDAFRPGQETIIAQILKGHSALAVFPTGSGKSLCYQLPALMLPGLTVVVSPLIALMKDQVEFLQKRSIKVARLDSSLGGGEARQVYRDLKAGALKLLYVAPERIANERFFAAIENQPIDLMVIDEAHCISEWGHNFRPEYLKLAIAARNLKVGRVLALTATATPMVVEDIRREFAIPLEAYVNTGFHRPNLHLAFRPTSVGRRIRVLEERLTATPPGPTVVYVTLQKTAEAVASALGSSGHAARAYHAGLKSDERAAIQDWFMDTGEGIVVATIAFGMGIDKADIRRVFHYNLPKSLENYSQEIGRAGRDGQPAHCELLGSEEDLIVLENFIYGDTPTAASISEFARYILSQKELFDVSTYHLSQQTDIRPLVLNTLLTYLELEGILKFTAPFYSEYKFRSIEPLEDTLQAFDASRRSFLERLFAETSSKKTWSYLDLGAAAAKLGEDRSRIVKAFNYLEETGRLEVVATGLRQGLRLLRRPDEQSLVKELSGRMQRNEASNVKRTQQVVELVNATGCKTRYLLDYFGENLNRPCGHCSGCAPEGEAAVIGSGRRRELLGEELQRLRNFREQQPFRYSDTREAARFLCGIASPRFTRERLNRHPLFGSLETTPFPAVLAAVEAGSGAASAEGS